MWFNTMSLDTMQFDAMIQHYMIRHYIARHCDSTIHDSKVWFDTIWLHTLWFNTIWLDTYDSTLWWQYMTLCDLALYDSTVSTQCDSRTRCCAIHYSGSSSLMIILHVIKRVLLVEETFTLKSRWCYGKRATVTFILKFCWIPTTNSLENLLGTFPNNKDMGSLFLTI